MMKNLFMMNWKKGVKELEEEITELKEDEEEILNQDAGILVNFGKFLQRKRFELYNFRYSCVKDACALVFDIFFKNYKMAYRRPVPSYS